MRPICTIMIGRLDDWLHVLEKRDSIVVSPGDADWAGIACFKRAYAVFQERGYRAHLLAAAYRHHRHWSELIGGDISMTIPYEWQKVFNGSDIEVKERFNDPIPADVFERLWAKFADFRRAYEPDGMTAAEFDAFGPTVRTLRTFIGSYHELVGMIRDLMLPNPDVK
jgi:transaldolase